MQIHFEPDIFGFSACNLKLVTLHNPCIALLTKMVLCGTFGLIDNIRCAVTHLGRVVLLEVKGPLLTMILCSAKGDFPVI